MFISFTTFTIFIFNSLFYSLSMKLRLFNVHFVILERLPGVCWLMLGLYRVDGDYMWQIPVARYVPMSITFKWPWVVWTPFQLSDITLAHGLNFVLTVLEFCCVIWWSTNCWLATYWFSCRNANLTTCRYSVAIRLRATWW